MQRLGKLLKWASSHKPFPSLHQACWFGWRAASCAWLSWTPQGPRCPPRLSRGLSRTSQQTVRKERRSVSAGPSLCPRPPPRTSTRASMPWCVQRNRPKSFPSPRRPASINTASPRPPSSYGQMWCRWARACVWLVSVPTATSWPSGEKCVRLREGPGGDSCLLITCINQRQVEYIKFLLVDVTHLRSCILCLTLCLLIHQ